MGLLWITVLGFVFNAESVDCTEVIHKLRTNHQLTITSTVESRDTVVFTLTDRYGFKKKTVQMGCEVRDVNPE